MAADMRAIDTPTPTKSAEASQTVQAEGLLQDLGRSAGCGRKDHQESFVSFHDGEFRRQPTD